jgi:archaeal type IV pilus assembly protein PilA
MKRYNTHAVSPIVGVMMMLVVTIIIAAVVSAFAGGAVSGQKKVPQATINGKFSISNGLQIIHSGGDGLATAETVFTIRDGSMFGQNLEQKTAQVLNTSLITDAKGIGIANVPSFVSGDTLMISDTNSACNLLQPTVYASNPGLCISNTSNVGKTFSLEVSDTRGNLISKSDVIISP